MAVNTEINNTPVRARLPARDSLHIQRHFKKKKKKAKFTISKDSRWIKLLYIQGLFMFVRATLIL